MSVRRGGHAGSVSLMIKVCGQDGPHVVRLVRHIIGQLGPQDFLERFVAVDPRPGRFLRQYGPASREQLQLGLDTLVQEGAIDFWYETPTDPVQVRLLNRRWFGCETDQTHSVTDVPVAPQLDGFERAQGEYLLQADVDVIIGRRDRLHDFLSDMAFALDADPMNVSVSFNIAHQSTAYRLYSAPPGGFVPEVRCCLLDRRKLFALRPLPNSLDDAGRLQLTWYRSLQQRQQEEGWLSLRGGDGRSFFIHPQNGVKRAGGIWPAVQAKVEQGCIPAVQYEHHDLVEDWPAWEACTGDAYEQLILAPHELLAALAVREGLADGQVVVLRHGDKQQAAVAASAASLDRVDLSEAGADEVRVFAHRLPSAPAMILTPSLPRCIQTAREIAGTFRPVPRVEVLDVLLGAPFHQRAEWQALKRRLGWSQLVARWLEGRLERSLILPYVEWIGEARAAIEQHRARSGWTLMVTQGYLNSAFCHHLTGRIEYRGGPLHGFIWPADGLHWPG
ncbi:MAG: histidine phosphatase family protein [Myxococcota bacterium]|jgi:broad specificity phosphatase PhoE|nr:histidine phosphatase family protein [Myxococcota bacterium]